MSEICGAIQADPGQHEQLDHVLELFYVGAAEASTLSKGFRWLILWI